MDNEQTYRAPPPFQIGLAASGIAGPYPAGVLDFLLEALDAWGAAKKKSRSIFNSTLPPYSVKIGAVGGAIPPDERLKQVVRLPDAADPFESVRQAPRAGKDASRAVIAIDPFPVFANFETGYASLAGQVPEIKFKDEDLESARDPFVFSQFLIAPAECALAGGVLGPFSEFLPEEFRKHDFLLGRSDCQRFLRTGFVAPLANSLFRGWIKDHPKRKAILEEFGIERPTIPSYPAEKQWCLPVIPLMESVRNEIPAPPRPKLEQAEFQRVLEIILQKANLTLKFGWWKRRGLKKAIGGAMLKNLARYDLM